MRETIILQRMKAGDPSGLEALMACYLPYISVIVWNILRSAMTPQDGEEVVADVFLAAGTSGTVYPAAGFVHTAAKYGCSDRILVTLDSPSRDNEEGLSYGNVPQIEFTRRIYGSAVSLIPRVLEEIGKEIEKRAATSQS